MPILRAAGTVKEGQGWREKGLEKLDPDSSGRELERVHAVASSHWGSRPAAGTISKESGRAGP